MDPNWRSNSFYEQHLKYLSENDDDDDDNKNNNNLLVSCHEGVWVMEL